ncbi:helix-turn-helix domain-containing protein [Rubrobacter indicoceani]|uniref:helix-turn-helix domain-containing protein n=1 Tax=Rubrobacter indicoceani TaxID=2051957 RepID=UPI000E5BECE0|nr:helix-turn-helix transcriptional regulator [Rubrobacter indicoceani]
MVGRRELAARIADARERAGVSQAEVSERLKLPRSAISKMENGEQRIEGLILATMAQLYGVPIASLLESGNEAEIDCGRLPTEALLRSAGDVEPMDHRVLDEFLGMCRDQADLRRSLEEAIDGY